MRQTWNWFPDQGATVEEAPSVKVIAFGDDYEVRMPTGIHSPAEKWSLTFTDSHAQVKLMREFLRTHNGHLSFFWTTPDSRKAVFVCRKWRVKRDTGEHILTCEFEEVFEA